MRVRTPRYTWRRYSVSSSTGGQSSSSRDRSSHDISSTPASHRDSTPGSIALGGREWGRSSRLGFLVSVFAMLLLMSMRVFPWRLVLVSPDAVQPATDPGREPASLDAPDTHAKHGQATRPVSRSASSPEDMSPS